MYHISISSTKERLRFFETMYFRKNSFGIFPLIFGYIFEGLNLGIFADEKPTLYT